MAWFKRNDPIAARKRALNHEIAQLEAEIKKLGAKLQSPNSGVTLGDPAVRSEISPASGIPANSRLAPPVPVHEPIFEQLGPDRLSPRPEPIADNALYNELGVRRYDLLALLGRIRNHFRGPATTNPKLVNYLAAGGIQGLRPLRYEKRVARNRFLVLASGLFLVLLGLIWIYLRRMD